MQLFNHQYETVEKLELFVDTILLHKGAMFIQLFSGVMDKTRIQPILDSLTSKLPSAVLIGATTAGEIINGTMTSGEIIVSVSLFDSTVIKTYYFPKSDFSHGVRAAQEILSDRTKVCIVLSEGLKSDSESFLNGFTSIRNDVVVAGGNAGDDLTFTRTYIIKENTIYDEGVVIAVLESDVLEVHPTYSLNWTMIGKEMTITRAENNIVYEIDGRGVRELYTHYLGEETIEQIPASAVEFPLVKVEDGVEIARSMIAQTGDGGFVYAGHFHNGEKVRFAIGNVEEIMDNAVDIREAVATYSVEATYIYSCSVRKLFLKEQLNYEFGLIEEVAPTAGFFTYGEFFHSPSGNQLLNITTTTLSLSESHESNIPKTSVLKHHNRHTMLKSLTNLVNETQSELDDSIKILDQYKMVLDESSIVSKTDVEGVITYVNDAFCKISGYTRDELIGQKHNIIRHPDNDAELFKNLWKTIKEGRIWKDTFKNLSKNGEEYYVKTVIAPIFDDRGDVVEFIAARADVTELIVKDQIIRRQLIDTLSGLKNRTALLSDLENEDDDVVLILLNIDRFSTINDYFGYEIGDQLLKAFAARLETTMGHGYFYRISGDEFAIICIDHKFDDTLRDQVIEYINKLENFKYQISGHELSINVSGGIAHAPYSDVYNLAHMALKEAKEQRAKLIFFNDNTALTEKTRNNIWMFDKIKSAIEEDRIVPYFQGIVDNKTRKIVKYESLIRLIEPNGTVLSPYWFLEHAKKSKLYDKLTRIMIAKTFAVFENLDYEFSLNLTMNDIVSDETRPYIYKILEHSSAAKRVVFEIVESEGIVNYQEVIDFIKAVKQFGCKIAIDDFGTGYSNFSYLSKLDVDYIKIDGSLIKNINLDNDHLYTVESILFFANKKGIETIAEFVEDESIFNKVLELGIDYSQGYLFSTPQPTIET
ncbi:MAG: EAL domain-containing protein [Sulfuricurvum sp.]|uniref:EAL domain-containing protein n=1 Tax=Sulfuricurvum sp. TaxID=2025608 RepID=UPI00261DA71C|nr:EAL domain-containing protein [Sulfuricurvum sp.]MDD5158720.1 EAL domain-containing protein [Sulfuricurvum sp.]MDD5160214.1 EAL domain-containing protein [Sulfuricurvum sp.]